MRTGAWARVHDRCAAIALRHRGGHHRRRRLGLLARGQVVSPCRGQVMYQRGGAALWLGLGATQ